MAQIFDTIIVGAGWAGAVAARELAASGRSVLVLEARDRVGGRARTWVSSDGGAKVDLGCSWIHGYNEGNPARAIAASLGVTANIPKPIPGMIFGPDGPLSPEVSAKLGESLAAAQAAFKTPYPAPQSSVSLADALFSPGSPLTSTSQIQDLARGMARTLEVPLGLKLENASLRWAGWESVNNFTGSDAAPEGGFQALVERVLQDAVAAGATLRLGEQVVGISDGETIDVKTTNGGYAARTVISTIPLGVLKKLPPTFFQPALPGRLAEIVAGVHVGVLEKLVLKYPKAWWPSPESVGSYVFLPTLPETQLSESSSVQDILSASTLICANLASPSLPNGSPTLMTYLSETPARRLVTRSSEDVAAGFHNFLLTRFGITSAVPLPNDIAMTTWLTDQYACGATTTPSVVCPNGERSPMDFKELSRPLWGGRLGFAGEHTEMENRGSVAGAVISGQREAARVNRWLDKHTPRP